MIVLPIGRDNAVIQRQALTNARHHPECTEEWAESIEAPAAL